MQAIFSDPSFLDRKEGRRKGEGRDEERERDAGMWRALWTLRQNVGLVL